MFAMCRRTVNTTAAAAAVDASSCHGAARQRANAHIAITMDAALLASIFVALIGLLGILSLSLLLDFARCRRLSERPAPLPAVTYRIRRKRVPPFGRGPLFFV